MKHAWWKMVCAFMFVLFLMSYPALSQPLINIDELQFVKGDKNAPVVLIEFADYQCPFCARFQRETFPQIDRDYILMGKIKFIFRNFPLERTHPYAFKAAEVAICSGQQGKFWAMHNRLFEWQDSRSFNDWTRHAEALALDADKFMRCLEDDATASQVKKDEADGKSAGVRVTPTFFLGVIDAKTSQVKVLEKIEGAGNYPRFKKIMDNLIANVK